MTRQRRPRGDGGISWEEDRQRWRISVTVGYDLSTGRRRVRQERFKTKTEARARLRALTRDTEDGLAVPTSEVTVSQVVEDWLAFGLGKQGASTVAKYRFLASKHILPLLGDRRLRDLTTREVELWLADLSGRLSTETLHRTHACLNRAVRRALARDLVRRNVVEVAELPSGRDGRLSKSLTPEQVDGVLTRTTPDRLHAYIVLSLLTGARTEELRALRWEHVHLDGSHGVPPHVEVWRSVRDGGDTKTRRSRRTLALPERCIEVLRRHRAAQASEQLAAGERWQKSWLVFTTTTGTAMDAANVRRDFRRALAFVPGLEPSQWTPRELRHSFVSVLSDAGVPLEEISRLVGHSGTTVTELVYRHQLKPVIQTGAIVMDQLFTQRADGA